jgi:CubicO group peptidase (beta-lactamase class C family)
MKISILLYITLLVISSCFWSSAQSHTGISAFLDKTYRNNVIPGFSVVIVKDSSIFYLGAYGYENRTKGIHYSDKSISGIGSITKSFTALAIMQLSEKGKIDLEAPVIRYLPWFRTANKARSDKITVRMLINNTSGLQSVTAVDHNTGDQSIEKMVRSLKGTFLSREPGTSYEYSNTAFSVAGLIIQSVSGVPYARYMKENVLAPLEMRLTSFVSNERSRSGMNQGHYYGVKGAIPATYEAGTESGEFVPAGSMANSCAPDMGHYLIALLNKGNYKGRQIISNKSLEEMWVPQVSFPGISKKDGGDGSDFFYGLGWMISRIDGRSIIHHMGSTGKTSSITMIDKENNVAISILMNIDISFIDKYRYSNAIFIGNNILHLAAGEPVSGYGQPREKDPADNSYEIADSLISKYDGDYFLLSGGDNVVFYNVKLHIGIIERNQLKFSIARSSQIVEEFMTDFVSPVYAVSRNIGLADPIRFKRTPGGEITGLIFRGMEFARIHQQNSIKWKKVFMPADNLSIDIPVGWSSTRVKNKIFVMDTLFPENNVTIYTYPDDPVDLQGFISKEMAGSHIVYRGLEHSELIAGYNWRELSLVTTGNQGKNQVVVAIHKNENRHIVLVFHSPDGKMTSIMQLYFIPMLYSLECKN